ncbi:hypothetical protein PUR57_14605 [Streptomyces sp. JV176]|uniref:hypothetical protein n=1 Tax=unclassified Streptomyces TaxID=2593676 RepID=UPI002E76B3D5|nr:hypothetical protein [Streptomyces sp. JV176]MEE1799885.1 hypothetical protein [Streptomyces sp. JV176]
MSRHLRLRLAVLTAVAAGAMLVPATAAVASDQAQASVPHAAASEKPGDKSAGAKMKEDAVQKAAAARKAEAAKKAGADTVPRGAVAAGDAPTDESAGAKMKRAAVQKAAAARKAEAAKKAGADTVPRGAVAAGEAQAGSSGVAPLAGTAAGALLLAGAGTFVLRRRATARANG